MLGVGVWASSANTCVEEAILALEQEQVTDSPVATAEQAPSPWLVRLSTPWVVRYWGRVPYRQAAAEMEALVAKKIVGDPYNYLLLLEHEPVYTLGRGGDLADVRGADVRFGIPVYRVGRGGGVTYHGPGQLIAYPIVTLARRDVRWHVRRLEHAVVRVCRRFGVDARRGNKAVGVWVGDRKIGFIGLGVRHWVAFHGIALNIDVDVRYFDVIVPCRLPGLVVTSLAQELGWSPTWEEVAHAFWEELWGVMESQVEGANVDER